MFDPFDPATLRSAVIGYLADHPRATTAQIRETLGEAAADQLDSMADDGLITPHNVGGYIGWEARWMTETTRIRWEDKTPASGDVYNVASIGYVGTVEESAFIIYTPDEAHAGWLLSVRLTPGSRFFYGASQDELKDRAERWLEEFTASLGAVFLDDITPLTAPAAAGTEE